MQYALPHFRVRDLAAETGVGLALVLTLPFLAFLVFVLRPLVIVLILAGILVGGVLCAVSERFREWLTAQSRQIEYRGVRFDPDCALHPGHGWVRLNGNALVGADDLVMTALGPIDEIELPPVGQHVQRGESLFRLRHGDRSVEVTSPVSGVILENNAALRLHPTMINDDPFAKGWVARIQVEAPAEERRALLSGRRARTWFRTEVDRFLESLQTNLDWISNPGAPRPSPAEIHRTIDDSAWRRLSTAMFTARRVEPDSRR